MPSAGSVAGATQGFQQLLWLHLRHALKQFQQCRLFTADLCFRVLMLQTATTTHAKVRTDWLNPLWRGLEHLKRTTFVEFLAQATVFEGDGFTGQSVVDKHHLAINMRHATTFVTE